MVMCASKGQKERNAHQVGLFYQNEANKILQVRVSPS